MFEEELLVNLEHLTAATDLDIAGNIHDELVYQIRKFKLSLLLQARQGFCLPVRRMARVPLHPDKIGIPNEKASENFI